MRYSVFVGLFLLVVSGLSAQADSSRYHEVSFASVTKTSNVLFSSNDPVPRYNVVLNWLFGYKIVDDESSSNLTSTSLRYNIYEPTGDTIAKRAMVVLCFGGGFVAGDKNYWSMQLLADGFAKRGYVVASIDYRLGMHITDSIYSARAVYRGIQDSYAAISYFRANAQSLRIDPDKIFIGGHSAGAFVALHNLYMDNEPSERPLGTYQYGNAADQGNFLATSENPAFGGRANGGFSLAGAIGNPDFIDPGDPGIALFHSADDPTVNIAYDVPFKEYESLGLELPKVHGSDLIEDRFQELGIPYTYSRYTDRGHGVHELGDTDLYPDILPAISSWLYESHLKPTAIDISGNYFACASDTEEIYVSQPSNNIYKIWQLTGGTIVSGQGSDTLHVVWDQQASNHSISCYPVSYNHAAGDLVSKNIQLASSWQNTWNSPLSGNWNQAGNWQLQRKPRSCDQVVTGDHAGLPIDITLDDAQTTYIQGLNVGQGVQLLLENGSSLRLKP